MDGSRESGLWVPASAHQGEYDDEEEDEEASVANGESRGREERIETA